MKTKVKDALLCFFDSFRRAGESKFRQHLNGRFHVVYFDTEQRTKPFDFPAACDYADIFGGKVIHTSTGREVYNSEEDING